MCTRDARIDSHTTSEGDGAAGFGPFIEFAPDAIVGVDEDGRMVLVNAQTRKLFGYTREELIDEPVEMLVPERFRARHPAHRGAYFGNPRTRLMAAGLDLHGVRKDGTEFPAEITLSSVAADGGVVATAAIRDVSGRRQAHHTLRQFLEFAPDAIVGVRRDGRIALVNAHTEALFGYAREELIGELVELLVPERFRGRHPGNRDAYFANPKRRPMGAGLELFCRRKDGSEFPAEISLSSMSGENGELIATAAVRDVTERVVADRETTILEAELALERQHKAEHDLRDMGDQLNHLRRLESVGQLAGGIAHDFNNLLGVILNSAMFVAEELEPGSPALEDVEEIRRSAQRAAALTRQLLIFSRRDVVHAEALDLNEVVADLERLMRRVLGEHIALETRFAPGLWPVVADAGQLEQVLVNLAVNARDAMTSGGRLMIETSNVLLDAAYAAMHPGSEEGRYVRLTVSDTGIGMKRDVAARAFEPFFTTKAKGAGTGLGLSTVYGVVTDAGGNLQLYSEPGLGTTVKVQMPAGTSPPVARSARSREAPAAQGETLLVVEDDASVRRVTVKILTSAGYKVVAAGGGVDAMAICTHGDEPFQLLLTDVIMPDMFGPELAATATELRPGLKVLYMSGYTDQVIERHEAEGEPFLEKPFTAEDLLTAVHGALHEPAR